MKSLRQGASTPTRIDLRFVPTVATISSTRRFVEAFYEPLVGSGDAASRAALAAHELLENALKYSIDGRTSMTVDFVRSGGSYTITVETEHPVSAEQRTLLQELFDDMKTFTDATEYYVVSMQRSQLRAHGSGLGLARIWAEGEMRIEHTFDGTNVRISAAATIIDEGGTA